jgi:hypothetical protein
MESFLEKASSALQSLVTAGSGALDAYASYIEDCLRLSREMLRRLESH